MKLSNSANIDVINNCRWYFDFELSYEVLAKGCHIWEEICWP